MKISSAGTTYSFCCTEMQRLAENKGIKWEPWHNRAVMCFGVPDTDEPPHKRRVRFCPFCGERISKRRERKANGGDA